MEKIEFSCHVCGRDYSVAAEHAGKSTRCKGCATQLSVPAPRTPASDGRLYLKSPIGINRIEKDSIGQLILDQRIRPFDQLSRSRNGPWRAASDWPDLAPWFEMTRDEPVRSSPIMALTPAEPGMLEVKWARVCAVTLIVAFLLPFIIPRRGGTRFLWFWDVLSMPKASGLPILGYLLPPILGILTLIMLKLLTQKGLGVFLIVAPIVWVLFSAVLEAPSSPGLGRGSGVDDAPTVLVYLTLLAIPFIAAGNHLRAEYPASTGPRQMLGFAGAAVLLAFILPVADGKPLLLLALKPIAWRATISLPITLILVFGYGVVGIVSCISRGGATVMASIWLRILLFGVPGLLCLEMMLRTRFGFGIAITLLKPYASFAAGLGMIAIGLVAVMEATRRPT